MILLDDHFAHGRLSSPPILGSPSQPPLPRCVGPAHVPGIAVVGHQNGAGVPVHLQFDGKGKVSHRLMPRDHKLCPGLPKKLSQRRLANGRHLRASLGVQPLGVRHGGVLPSVWKPAHAVLHQIVAPVPFAPLEGVAPLRRPGRGAPGGGPFPVVQGPPAQVLQGRQPGVQVRGGDPLPPPRQDERSPWIGSPWIVSVGQRQRPVHKEDPAHLFPQPGGAEVAAQWPVRQGELLVGAHHVVVGRGPVQPDQLLPSSLEGVGAAHGLPQDPAEPVARGSWLT
mmetsp:Transcript_36117/g.84385  ORF Transcript_36117/g.84385 Transcript_36117/m.84385 type:complete len:281 (-) Transcript_36117:278-1120(-)